MGKENHVCLELINCVVGICTRVGPDLDDTHVLVDPQDDCLLMQVGLHKLQVLEVSKIDATCNGVLGQLATLDLFRACMAEVD